jgi:hypothetical protein
MKFFWLKDQIWCQACDIAILSGRHIERSLSVANRKIASLAPDFASAGSLGSSYFSIRNGKTINVTGQLRFTNQ